MNKAFVCIHGFGNHPGGRRHGFSYRLRDNVMGILGDGIVWKEVLWDDLLESPPKEPLTDFVFQTPEIVRK